MFNYEYNNFYEVLEKNAKNFPKKVAYFIDNRKVSWNRVKKKVDTFARTLEFLGVKKNDKVPVLVANSLEFIIAILSSLMFMFKRELFDIFKTLSTII